MSNLQLEQIRMLLAAWHRSMDDIAANEQDILATLESSRLDWLRPLSTAEIFDKAEDLLTAKALRLEVNLSLTMGLIHSVFTPFQCASFLAAAYPYFCDWITLAELLTNELPPA